MTSVLLVHGFASSFERNWVAPGIVELLTDAGHDVIGVDLLGHGDAPKPHDPAAYADLGARLLEVMPAEPVAGVGFSLGAQVLLGVAADAPDRFSQLIVAGVGANLFRSDDPEPLAAAVASGEAPAEHPLARAFVGFATGPGNDSLALAACLRRPRQELSAVRLASLGVPTTVVLGDRDFAGPADPLLEALPDARFIPLKGVDHFGTPSHFGFIDVVLDTLG